MPSATTRLEILGQTAPDLIDFGKDGDEMYLNAWYARAYCVQELALLLFGHHCRQIAGQNTYRATARGVNRQTEAAIVDRQTDR